MTSVEFVIWMRGFMAAVTHTDSLGPPRLAQVREQLAKVDGIPLPKEKRTILAAPEPTFEPPALPASTEVSP